jgi:hypothetical protein
MRNDERQRLHQQLLALNDQFGGLRIRELFRRAVAAAVFPPGFFDDADFDKAAREIKAAFRGARRPDGGQDIIPVGPSPDEQDEDLEGEEPGPRYVRVNSLDYDHFVHERITAALKRVDHDLGVIRVDVLYVKRRFGRLPPIPDKFQPLFADLLD